MQNQSKSPRVGTFPAPALCVTGGTNGNLQISNSKRFRSYLRTALDHSIFEIEIFLDEGVGDRFLYPVNRAVPGSPDTLGKPPLFWSSSTRFMDYQVALHWD